MRRLLVPDEHEQQDEQALEDDESHGGLPRTGCLRRLESHDCVQTHAAGQCNRKVGNQTHQNAADASRSSGAGYCRFKWNPCGGKDGRVGEQDIRHCEERGDSSSQLGGQRAATAVNVKVLIQHPLALGQWSGDHHIRAVPVKQ